jgi:hypothetical protein
VPRVQARRARRHRGRPALDSAARVLARGQATTRSVRRRPAWAPRPLAVPVTATGPSVATGLSEATGPTAAIGRTAVRAPLARAASATVVPAQVATAARAQVATVARVQAALAVTRTGQAEAPPTAVRVLVVPVLADRAPAR